MRSRELDLVVAELAREDEIRGGSSSEELRRTPRLGAERSAVTAAPADVTLDAEEEDLRNLKERFDQTHDAGARGELAVSALEQVERRLRLARERRRELDSIEGQLWTRRNRLERFLIQTKGRAWWHNRHQAAQENA